MSTARSGPWALIEGSAGMGASSLGTSPWLHPSLWPVSLPALSPEACVPYTLCLFCLCRGWDFTWVPLRFGEGSWGPGWAGFTYQKMEALWEVAVMVHYPPGAMQSVSVTT